MQRRAACLLISLVAALAGCGGEGTPTATPSQAALTHDIHGDLYFSGVTGNGAGLDRCIGGTMATVSGSEVELTDGAGVTLSVAHLVEAADSGSGASIGNGLYTCHQTFDFKGVKPADFYKVSVGGVKGPTFSASDLQTQGWTMTLHL